MPKAIEQGIPKMRIEESAARIQARIDTGRQEIIGVNSHRIDEEEDIPVLVVDNEEVRKAQLARLKKLREIRDEDVVQKTLDALTEAAKTGEIYYLSVEAARARANAERSLTRCLGTSGAYAIDFGVYRKELEMDSQYKKFVIGGSIYSTRWRRPNECQNGTRL